jgi:primase-polymerase (primpol)-like protein
MYNEQLEKLIEMALMDGELTEKEKQILFKKAEAFGVDLDEFEMVLEAKLFEKQQATKKAETPVAAAPKSDKYGDVRKCPACGAMVQTFQTKCPDCGHDYRNVQASASIQKFFNDYTKINQSVDIKVEKKQNLKWHDVDTSEIDADLKRKEIIYERQKDFISNFPVPNSKEDILEFLSLALPFARKYSKKSGFGKVLSNIRNAEGMNFRNHDYLLAKVWHSKCEQIIMKARFSMKEDKKTLDEINYYANELNIK